MLLRWRDAAEKSCSSAPAPEPWQTFKLWYKKHVYAEKHKEQCCQSKIRNICGPNGAEMKHYDFWQSSGTLATLHPLMRTQFDAEPSKADLADFTSTLSAIFSSDADPLPDVGASPGPTPVFGIRQFSCAEMQGAIQNAGGRGAHGGSLMLELFKHDPPCLHVRFLFTMI